MARNDFRYFLAHEFAVLVGCPAVKNDFVGEVAEQHLRRMSGIKIRQILLRKIIHVVFIFLVKIRALLFEVREYCAIKPLTRYFGSKRVFESRIKIFQMKGSDLIIPAPRMFLTDQLTFAISRFRIRQQTGFTRRTTACTQAEDQQDAKAHRKETGQAVGAIGIRLFLSLVFNTSIDILFHRRQLRSSCKKCRRSLGSSIPIG